VSSAGFSEEASKHRHPTPGTWCDEKLTKNAGYGHRQYKNAPEFYGT